MLLYQYRSERLSPYCRGCCTFDSDIASKPPVRTSGPTQLGHDNLGIHGVGIFDFYGIL